MQAALACAQCKLPHLKPQTSAVIILVLNHWLLLRAMLYCYLTLRGANCQFVKAVGQNEYENDGGQFR